MDSQIEKDEIEPKKEEVAVEKKKQNAPLIVLLFIICGSSYLYFFTDVFSTQDSMKQLETPASQTQSLLQSDKKPLPPRNQDVAKDTLKISENVSDKKESAEPKTDALPKANPPVAEKAAAPKPTAVKTVEKPKELPKKVEDKPKPVEKKSPVAEAVAPKKVEKAADKAVVAKKEESKTSQSKKEVATVQSAAVAKKDVKKPSKELAANAKPVKEPVVAAEKTTKSENPIFTVMIGNYVLEDQLSIEMGRVRKAGFEPVAKPAARKKTVMNRLFVADFPDRDSAKPLLQKLRQYTSDAFIIDQNGRSILYAGSYLQPEAANAERERLKTAGVLVTLKNVEIAIPTKDLTIESFKNKKDAEAAVEKLKAAGVKATILNK